MLRHGLGVGIDIDRVADDVEHAATLEAGGGRVTLEHHGDGHADLLAGGEALEVDMLRLVGHGVELHVADERAGSVRAELHLIEAGPPAAAMQFLDDRARLEGDKGRSLASHRR